MAITAEMRTQVLELYTAYFNRAADKAGVDYWTNEMNTNGWTLDQVAQSFADQTEYTTAYAGMTNAEVVTAVYTNVLNRDADEAGSTYWVDQLDAGTMSVENLIQAVVTAAKEDKDGLGDADILANKVAVSEYAYAEDLSEAAAKAVSLTAITADATTVETVKAEVVTAKADYTPVSASLTTGADSLTGSKADDTFTAAVLSANDGDTINGSEGNDTLNLEIASNLTNKFTATNIETVNLNALGAVSVDMKNMADVETLNSNDASGAVTVNNIAKADMALGIKGSATNDVTLNYVSGTLNGNSDTLNVSLNGTTSTTIDADSGFESVAINTTAESTISSVTAPNATNLTLSGDAALTIAANAINSFSNYTVTNTAAVTYATITSVKTFDASSNTSGIVGKNLNQNTNLTNGTTSDVITLASTGSLVQTGSGNDNINVNTTALYSTANGIIKLGAGNDILNLSGVSSGGDFVYAEAGDDTIYVGGALTSSDLVDGGAGTDTVNFSANSHSLIAKGIEKVGVNGATSVSFVSVDSAIDIADSGAAAVSFSNLKNSSTYTASVAKTGDISLGFATSQAATFDANLTKGSTHDITTTNVADLTVTLGAASNLTSGTNGGDITTDAITTALTVKATGAFVMDDVVASGKEKIQTITVTGDKAITIDDIANLDSLTTLSVTSTGGNAQVGQLDNSGYTTTDQTVTKLEVVSEKGSAELGNGGKIDLAGVTSTVTGKIETISVKASGGTTASDAIITNVLADTIGTITATSTTADATIGNITAGANTAIASGIDGTVDTIKASGFLQATIGNIKADKVTSIVAESTDTTTGGAVIVGVITDGSATTTNPATPVYSIADIGTIDLSSKKSSVELSDGTWAQNDLAIDVTKLGNVTLDGATTATIEAISVKDANGTGEMANLTVTAGSGTAKVANIAADVAGTIAVKSTSGDVQVSTMTFTDTSGVTVNLTSGAKIEASATDDIIANTKGDLNVTMTAETTVGATSDIFVQAGATSILDTDLVVDMSAVKGAIANSGDAMEIKNFSQDANSSTVVKGGQAANEITIHGAAAGTQTIEYYGQTGADIITIDGTYASSTVRGESGNDTIITGAGVDTIIVTAGTNSITAGLGADKITLGSGVDTILIDGGLTSDTISSLTAGTGGDKLNFDISVLDTNAKVNSHDLDLVEIYDNNSVADANGTAAALGTQTLTGAGTASDAKNIFLLDLGTTKFANAAAAVDALETGGDAALTFAGNIAQYDAFFIAYENTTGGVNIAVADFLAADDNSGGAATTAVDNLEGTDLVTLSGISDVTTLTTANLFAY